MPYSIAFYVDSVPFGPGEISGEKSLGGSESACLGLARALAQRGHDVHLFATKLDPTCEGRDQGGVIWHDHQAFSDLSQCTEWDLFCSLRMAQFFAGDWINARLRWLWNQDLLIGESGKNLVMATCFQVDRYVYVSEYHRHQWEAQLPQLAPFGWVSKNGFDPSLVPTGVEKDTNRVIHISRPERAMDPILAMWPAIKAARPDATLAVCRYNSMYDAGGWGKVCEAYDRRLQELDAKVGGIVWLGELGKPALYRELAKAAVMWYPGVATFAETSCIAALEAQACGTPIVASYRGALPETAPGAFLVHGDAHDEGYQQQSVRAVIQRMGACEPRWEKYQYVVDEGRRHVQAYTFDTIAAEWEAEIARSFSARLEHDTRGVARRLLHDDDHVAAKYIVRGTSLEAFCEKVIDGKDQTAEQYGSNALEDPIREGNIQPRFHVAADALKGVTSLLDIACGNGAFALYFARQYPEARVVGVDYSQRNIDRAQAAAEAIGVSDRVTFKQAIIYDFDRHELAMGFKEWLYRNAGFDGLFVGEFLEHTANTPAMVDGLERGLSEGATCVYTMPNGPMTELMPRGVPIHRGHVHRFCQDDLAAVFGKKQGHDVSYLSMGYTPRGRPVGHWMVRYQVAEGRVSERRPIRQRITSARPYPRLSVGLIGRNVEHDLGRCLESVWPFADEIIYGDTGSGDRSREIAQEFGATVIDLAPIEDQPEGFAGARNQVLDRATGEWFLWIDADEVLLGGQHVAKYLDPGGPLNGYVIRQRHLYLDLPPSHDIPVRLFRRRPDIRFYGCIHEQPQQIDCNGEIFPCLELEDVVIAHYGYLTEGIRRAKMRRNLPFLKKDQERFPDRELGKVLVMRDLVNLAQQDRQERGAWSTESLTWLAQAVGMFDTYVADPAHKLHKIARPWYEVALQELHRAGVSEAMEMEIALGGQSGGLGKRRPRPERVWVRTIQEYEALVTYKIKKMAEASAAPVVDTTPYAVPVSLDAEAVTA